VTLSAGGSASRGTSGTSSTTSRTSSAPP
jgi:hypothetical protein